MQDQHQPINRVSPDQAAELLNLAPNDPTVRFYRAVALFEAGKTKAAVTEFFALASLGIPAAAAYALNYRQLLSPAQYKQLAPIKAWYDALDYSLQHKVYLQVSKDIAKINNKPAAAVGAGSRARSRKNKGRGKARINIKPATKAKATKAAKLITAFLRKTTYMHHEHFRYHKAHLKLAAGKRQEYLKEIYDAARCGHLLAIAEVIINKLEITKTNEFFKAFTNLDHYQADGQLFADRLYQLLQPIETKVGRLGPQYTTINFGAPKAFLCGIGFGDMNPKSKFALAVLLHQRGYISGLLIANDKMRDLTPADTKTAGKILDLFGLDISTQISALLTAVVAPNPVELSMFNGHDGYTIDIYRTIANLISDLKAPLATSAVNDELIQKLQACCDSGAIKIPYLKLNLLSAISDYYCRGMELLDPATAIVRADITLNNMREVVAGGQFVHLVEYLFIAREQLTRKKKQAPNFDEAQQHIFIQKLLPYIVEIDKRFAADADPQQINICKLAIYIAELMVASMEFTSDQDNKALAEKYVRIARENFSPEFTINLAKLVALEVLPEVRDYNLAAELFATNEDSLDDYVQILLYAVSLLLSEPTQSGKALEFLEQKAPKYPIYFCT